MQNINLSARSMLDTLLDGNQVGINIKELGAEDARSLLNNLNVVKSRSKKLYESLGFDFKNAVITIHPDNIAIIEIRPRDLEAHETVYLRLTKRPIRKYSVFVLPTEME